MQKTASKRLMALLTGKELFAAIMQSYSDMLQRKPVTFTDDALDHAKAGIFKKPHETREFYRWCDSKQVIDYLVTEIRVDAMQTNWQLSTLLHYCFEAMQGCDSPHKTPERLQQKAHRLQHSCCRISLYIAALDAFADVLHVNLSPLLQGGVETLEGQLELYNDIRTMFDEYLMLENQCAEELTDSLPAITLQPPPRATQLQTQLTESLHHHTGNDFTSLLTPIIDAMDHSPEIN